MMEKSPKDMSNLSGNLVDCNRAGMMQMAFIYLSGNHESL
jgi:hypothetical protein